MANNTLEDLNNHLFAQMERLTEECISDENLKREISRAKAVNGVSKNIIDNAKTHLEGLKLIAENIDQTEKTPTQFRVKG